MNYVPPYGHSKNIREVELDLSNYVTKYGLKNASGVKKPQLAKKR